MKFIRRFVSLILITIVMLSTFSLPVSAAVGGRWAGRFKSFEHLSRGSKGRFVGALQRYLMSFDNQAESLLAYKNSNGDTVHVDCDFGGGTEAAVRYVQTQLGCKSDGMVWEGTWEKIELDLNRYTDPNYKGVILKRSLYNPNYVYIISPNPDDGGYSEVISYFEENNNARKVTFATA